KTNQEPPQDSDIHLLIEECSIKVPEEQKQKMENTMFKIMTILILAMTNHFLEEIRLIENLLYDNSFPRAPKELNAEIADTIIESIPLPIPVPDGNSQQEEIDIITETDDVLPPSDDNGNNLSNDSLLGEAYLFLFDNSIPPGIENVADDPEGDIHFLEE
nr:hypothetical protein [Tanacetum cinerariifolium]